MIQHVITGAADVAVEEPAESNENTGRAVHSHSLKDSGAYIVVLAAALGRASLMVESQKKKEKEEESRKKKEKEEESQKKKEKEEESQKKREKEEDNAAGVKDPSALRAPVGASALRSAG